MSARVRRSLRQGAPTNPFTLFSCCLDPQELRLAARTKARAVAAVASGLPPWPGHVSRGDPRLRVGILSCTLRCHADGFLMREMIADRDRERFAFVVYPYVSYPYHDGASDDFTRTLLASFDAVVDLAGLSDAEAVTAIWADTPDVLIDIDLYADGSRPAIAAARCAPLQLKVNAIQ